MVSVRPSGTGIVFVLIAARVVFGQQPSREFLRLAEEAEAFGRLAPKVIGQETLEQVAALPPPRYKVRGALPDLVFKTRQIVSEYGFSTFRDDGNMHEVRHVLTVDGKHVKEKGKLRETLSMGLQGDADKVKKKLVRDFESYGLRESATDFGQAILMFQSRSLNDFQFTHIRDQLIGPDRCRIYRFEQKAGGPAAMTVFEGKRVMRHTLKGEIALRQSDSLPLRITIDSSRSEEKNVLRHYAVIDYQKSSHGGVLPAAVNYAESVNGRVLVENRFQYSDFKLFDASSELKFTVDETPPKSTPSRK